MSFAGIKANTWVLAETLQMPRETFWPLQECCKHLEKLFGLCRNAANASRNFLAFAGMLQTPRKTFWPLQECCKRPEKLFGLCRNAANASKSFSAFAGTLQTLSPETKDRDMTSRPPTRRMRGGVTRHEGKNVRSDGGVSGLN